MVQNFKVDVIYYKTNTDFEMEFNLCGCCRMRLLTDKVSDRKTLVHSLARAVSRSRVIILVGALFGKESVLKLAAGAIGSKLVPADNKAFGISGDDEILILDGSTPLVTPEGYFGGCIVESGPQTMILLSDNKNVRKTVMNTLIHPYIEDVSASNIKKSRSSTSEQDTPDKQPEPEFAETIMDITPKPNIAEEPISEAENTEANVLDEVAEVGESEEVGVPDKSDEFEESIPIAENMTFDFGDDEPDTAPAEDENDPEPEFELLVTPEPPEKTDANEIIAETDEDLSIENGYDFVREKPLRSRFLNLPISIISVLMLIVLAVLCYCIFYVPSKDGIAASIYIREIFFSLFG